MNTYAYVGNDPVNAIDPLGLSPASDECKRICDAEGAEVDVCIAVRIPKTEYKSVTCHCKNTKVNIEKGKTKNSPRQIETELSPEEAIKNLEENGYKKTPFDAQNGGTGYELTNGERPIDFTQMPLLVPEI